MKIDGTMVIGSITVTSDTRNVSNSTPSSIPSCYRMDSGDYVWTNIPQSGWELVQGVTTWNDCMALTTVDEVPRNMIDALEKAVELIGVE